MSRALDVLETRLAEIDLFLDFVSKLQRRRLASSISSDANESIPVLKACAILMLYNVVESCVRTAFSEVYDAVAHENLKFAGVSEQLKDLWLQQQLDAVVVPESANRDTYLKATSLIAKAISLEGRVEIEPRKLPISGNLDAERIYSLCKKHGVELIISKWARGGWQLTTIKDQRNALSHGHKSFSECGREYAVADLKRISKQTTHFLKGLIKSLQRYQDSNLYRARPDAA